MFTDGSATPYADGLTLTDDQKNAAIAVIFYAENSSGTLGAKTLGVGLVHNSEGSWWCKNNSVQAYDANITSIQCAPSGSGDSFTFTGDIDGSDNLSQIKQYLTNAEGKSDDTGTAAYYPALYFAKNYYDQSNTHVFGTSYSSGWYLPSIAELYEIYRNKTTINAASDKCGGSQFGGNYWSSSQDADTAKNAYMHSFDDNQTRIFGGSKYSKNKTCAIRKF